MERRLVQFNHFCFCWLTHFKCNKHKLQCFVWLEHLYTIRFLGYDSIKLFFQTLLSNSKCQTCYKQRQPSRGVLKNACSSGEEHRQIALRQRCSPINLLHICKIPFYKNNFGGLLLYKNPCEELNLISNFSFLATI